jgi:superfamily II DNA or RNA helicase
MVLELNGVQYAIEDRRTVTNECHPLHARNVILRDYQAVVVKDALEKKSGLVPVAVGGGKTEIAITIIGAIGARSLFLVTTQELLYQTQDRIQKALGVDVGLIGNGEFEPKHITVGTWQTVYSRGVKRKVQPILDYLQSVDLLVVDECHHLGADVVYDVARVCPARYRYGLSGTMFRSDGASLKFYAAIGEQLKGITASELIDQGYLVPPIIKFIKTPEVGFAKGTRWRDVYREAVVENYERNSLLAGEASWMVHREGRQTLVMVSEVAHGKALQAMLDWPFIHSQASERSELYQEFKAGNLRGLISTPIFDEGVDIPGVSGIVLAGAGKSPVKAVQRVGRGLRTAPGKTNVRIIDTFDPVRYLQAQSVARFEMYKSEPKFQVTGEVPVI